MTFKLFKRNIFNSNILMSLASTLLSGGKVLQLLQTMAHNAPGVLWML